MMTNIRRYWQDGNICFLTNVTLGRKKILIKNIDLFKSAIRKIKTILPFNIIAWVILPDHFHFLIDPKGAAPSIIIKRIKLTFSMNYRKRMELRSGRIWQYRFWDHIIRNQDDMNKHTDYIHYNPVKHGLVKNPFDWKESSLGIFYKKGLYIGDWGVVDKIKLDGEFGE
jgi:putative transposase